MAMNSWWHELATATVTSALSIPMLRLVEHLAAILEPCVDLSGFKNQNAGEENSVVTL